MRPIRETPQKKDVYRQTMRIGKKIFQGNGKAKIAGVAILTSDKTDFKTMAIKEIQNDTS